jgi:predicted metal-dependent hydrolase
MGRHPDLTILKKRIVVDTFLDLEGVRVPLKSIRNAAAKRYILRLHRDGYIQITIPCSGNRKHALLFVEKNRQWLRDQWLKREAGIKEKAADRDKREIYYKGKLEPVEIRDVQGQPNASFAGQSFPVDLHRLDLKQWLEAWLNFKAKENLSNRVWTLALKYGFKYNKVTIRDQRTRWGSCSSNKTISLNWRLIQIPPKHCDYIILHELNHLKHMDHSIRFWRSLEAMCPWFRESEAWLKVNSHYLRD